MTSVKPQCLLTSSSFPSALHDTWRITYTSPLKASAPCSCPTCRVRHCSDFEVDFSSLVSPLFQRRLSGEVKIATAPLLQLTIVILSRPQPAAVPSGVGTYIKAQQHRGVNGGTSARSLHIQNKRIDSCPTFWLSCGTFRLDAYAFL